MASARLATSLEPPQGQGDVQSPAGLAFEPVPQKRFGTLEAVGDRPVGQVQPASGLPTVPAGIEEHLERLDQFIAHAGIAEQRSELAPDDRRREVRVAEEESLDAKLGQVIDGAVSTDPVRDPKAFLELDQRRREPAHALDVNGDRRP
jgi:hypothetical protein